MEMPSARRSGKLVLEAEGLQFAYESDEARRPIVENFDLTVQRGDRLAIIGPNGSGKTTLLRLLIGELAPQAGQLRWGANLEIAYFDQSREQLNPEKSVRDNLCEGGDYVTVKGKPRHVIGYLKQFLFPPERIDTPVKVLSGGEKNRLMLAQLFTQSANMLVLDEPTNDLDVDTLELLEDLLIEFDGTILLVSHDRAFIDNVVTSTLIFGQDGNVSEHVGGYEEWMRFNAEQQKSTERVDKKVESMPVREKPDTTGTGRRKKLSYREKTELEQLPERIEGLEQEKTRLESDLSSADFYQQDSETISRTVARLEQLSQQLADAYQRWEELEAIEHS